MTTLFLFLALSADLFFGPVNVFFALAGGEISLAAIGCMIIGIIAFAFAVATAYSDISSETLAAARRWHGSIDEQFGNIDNLVVTLQAHASWGTPTAVFQQIVNNRAQLTTLIPKCRSTKGTAEDRNLRNQLLNATVGMCVIQVKTWAYGLYYNNTITLTDLYSMGFLLPGASGGKHEHAEATDILAEAKVRVVSADIIRVVIDQSADENAALVVHGWPPGVRMALIVITAADGVTEVLRLHTTHLHNDIEMPAGSHGKQFTIMASFLRHVDDKPRFGPQPTFTMPFTTNDLAAALDRQHYEDFQAAQREIERHRQELEQIRPTDEK